MKRIILKVNYYAVLDEVAKTTAYVAAKMDGDATATGRVATVTENSEIMERFWHETEDVLLREVKRQLALYEDRADGTLVLTLEVGSLFNDALLDSMRSSLYSYFVNGLVSRWFVLANRNEAAAYAEATASYLKDIVLKALDRNRPERRRYPPLVSDEMRRGKGRHRHGHDDSDEGDCADWDTDEDEEEDEDTDVEEAETEQED